MHIAEHKVDHRARRVHDMLSESNMEVSMLCLQKLKSDHTSICIEKLKETLKLEANCLWRSEKETEKE
eukprot:7104601-Karenia_brevis.AAC.1